MPTFTNANPKYVAAREIVLALRIAGHQAYFAGGCVRDLLLGLEPKDFDVATSATPDGVQNIFPTTLAVGAHFGVILVCTEAGISTEVATFRHDGAYSDGRRPDTVRFSTVAREDVLRRDFTINGMLRAVRFAARLDLEIEPRTMAEIRNTAAQIGQVSIERIREELKLMLTEGHARRAFELLDATGLLQQVMPEITRMHGVQQPPQFHPEGDVWTHTMLLLEKLQPGASATLAWGALLHDVGKPATYRAAKPNDPNDRIRFNGHVEVGVRIAEEILGRMRFSNDDTAQIIALVKNHMRFGDV